MDNLPPSVNEIVNNVEAIIKMENKALITGSSRGLGLYLAKFFNKKGYKIILHGSKEENLKDTLKSLANQNDFEYFSCDLAKLDEIKGLCNFAIEKKLIY